MKSAKNSMAKWRRKMKNNNNKIICEWKRNVGNSINNNEINKMKIMAAEYVWQWNNSERNNNDNEK